MNGQKILSFLVVSVVIFFSAGIVFGSWYTIDEGEQGVQLRTGEVVGIAGPGLHFKVPFIDEVVRFSMRTERREYDKLESYSKDVQAAEISLSLNYSLRPDAVVEVYTKYGTNYAYRIVDPKVYERLKEVFGGYTAASVVSDRVRLGAEVEQAIRESIPEVIRIEGVQIENIDFSDGYEQAIESAMQAEAEVRKFRNQLEREKVQAETVVVQARARADAVRAAAEAEAEAIRLRGRAEADAITARGQALRDNPNLVKLVAAEKWNGVLPTHQIPQGAVPFVTIPQD